MIADNYQCEIADITSNNLHITDYKNLKPGMKLKIPFLTRPIMETLEETESFVSDYYPSLNTDFKDVKKEVKPEVKQEEVIVEEPIVEETSPIREEPVEEVKKTIVSIPYYGNVMPTIPERFIKKI